MTSASASALQQRMLQVEQDFRREQSRVLEKFLAEQRNLFEQSLGFAGTTSAKQLQPSERDPGSDDVRNIRLGVREKTSGKRSDEFMDIGGEERLLLSSDSDSDVSQAESESQQQDERDGCFKCLWGDREMTPLKSLGPDQEHMKAVAKKPRKPRNAVQGLFFQAVESKWFEVFTTIVVLSTVFQLGFDIHYKSKEQYVKLGFKRREDGDPIDPIADTPIVDWGMQLWIFANLAGFCLEMVFRIGADQQDFLCPPHKRKWNLFDCVLLADQLAAAFNWFELGENALVCGRIVRLIRMVRVFEVFPELREMLYSVAACASSMGWAMVLMFTCFWAFACFLMEVSSLHASSLQDEYKEILAKHWNGIFHSVLSLVYTITGGIGWEELARPFFAINAYLGALYGLFVVVTLFGMMNVIVGIFVRNTEKIAMFDNGIVLAKAFQERNDQINNLKELFREIDEENTGDVTEEAFKKALQRPRIQAFFHHLQIHYGGDPGTFWRNLDITPPHGSVDINEFTKGCMRLHGTSKPEDIFEIVERLDGLARHTGAPVPKHYRQHMRRQTLLPD